MKYILTLLISISFVQVIAPIGMGEGEYKVTWCVREEISDPCPNAWTKDEFGRDVFYGCLVYHFHYEYNCTHSKNFDSYEKAEKFAKKAIEESDISKVKLNGTLIPKPKVEWINVDVDSISLASASTALLSVGIATAIVEIGQPYYVNKPITINDVFDYIEYCDNDSVAWETDIVDSTEWINGIPIYHRSWVTIMIPKQPTFRGFGKWYRSKQ